MAVQAAPDPRDVVVVGGGHNGLVCAAYLARAGLSVTVVESRTVLGGPVGTYEFMPGYRTAFTNSPGSFEPTVLRELDLTAFGLRFVRPDPTLFHPFDDGAFVGWRDPAAVDRQLEGYARGEARRYRALVARLDDFGRALGASVFEPPPDLSALVAGLGAEPDQEMFARLFLGGVKELLDEHLRSDQAKAILTMLAVNGNLLAPAAAGSGIGLLLRPLSKASTATEDPNDPNRSPIRGSVGLPVGSMGAIIDALERCCRSAGVEFVTGDPVAQVLTDGDRVTGAVTESGRAIAARTVVSAVSPDTLVRRLLDEPGRVALLDGRPPAAKPTGSAFKIVLGLDGLPGVRALPEGATAEQILGVQFRVGPSPEYIERSILDGLAGVPSQEPIMWGLVPSLTSPGLAPPGRHLMSINVWHAPYTLREGDWETERDVFGRRCLAVLDRHFPGLSERVVDHRFMDPVQLETELGLPGSNITHEDMTPGKLFGFRAPTPGGGYRSRIPGLFLTGAGTWPGGYVTGVPGRNSARAVLAEFTDSTK
ncbi:phytoene desaturase family protein [Nocardiopsis ansamitocini]|uniref:Pyridine nucleotide-disulfide oxidoreductase domain-containing protein 2 n=1 Tax=Nocardiopsis ansamitocini TaxID=1670832 RepID=A0A9W6UJE3_9ACTN|nr:NAD(P)/FAD-dependent oxidoreductase [Nocardiopsis ansamitocini]GLU48739.1 FAD-dependent oxidoreductase [Nocardiopsis ansamitocini]